ncbi:MAG TPA: pre-peptidase C-terminal domain-containing protein, partial [Candidatus Limnocylindrales bacterium]|nr:pre-peptidase C-terminal domain-containing protein [Candidatus Limnocylindrales bacterium]
MKPFRILLMFFIAASTWLCHAIDHSPRWIGNTVKYGPENSLNGLVDLDNFPVGSYGYCKWGVLQDEDDNNTVTLDFTQLTAGPFANSTKALFLSRSTDFLQRLQFPADAEWNPANGSYQGGNVHFTQFPDLNITPGPSINVAMFRYLQFSPILFTTESNGNESQLRASTKKLIVLIHGWNPNSDFDGYGGNFASLDMRLRSQITNSDWKLLKYHWEADADTGPGFGFETVSPAEILKNGTESAEIAHQHGQHLGELLNETCPNLESIHLIAHSGASWAARAAAKFLLSRNPNLIVEVTLLDPFIPAAAGADSSLTRENMNAMALFQGNNRIFQLENYYSVDITGPGTQQSFDWRASDVKDFRVDWSTHYGDKLIPGDGHTGPIQFYSDTVASTVPGGTVPSDLANAPYYADFAEQLGWWRSLFWNEPVFDQQPQSQPVNAGQSATFTIHPNTRRARFDSAEAVGLTVQWQKDGVNLPGETFTTLTVANATAASAGEYVAVVSNPAGRRKSNPAILTVNGGSGAPTITLQPQDQTAEVGQTATFSVGATGNGSLSYQWKRYGAEISGATAASYTTSTVSLINDGYTYQVVVTDSQGFKASRIATLNVSAVTGSCSDPNEPNDSSLTATPLAFGAPTNGYICTATDVDWFRVLVTTNSLLTVTLNVPAGLDYDLEVYGPDALWRAGSYGAAGQDEVITTPVSPGNYYLRVYGFPAGSGDFSPSQPYQLSASTLVIPTSGTVSGTLTNSASWGGVVDITGDITIPAGTILNILPGTLVRCHAGSDSRSSGTDASRVEIILNGGTLNAVGTSGSPIVFTSDAVNKSSGDWYGIRLVAGSVSLSHFLIEFAVNGLRLEDSDTRFDSYLVEHGTIRNSSSYGLFQT